MAGATAVGFFTAFGLSVGASSKSCVNVLSSGGGRGGQAGGGGGGAVHRGAWTGGHGIFSSEGNCDSLFAGQWELRGESG